MTKFTNFLQNKRWCKHSSLLFFLTLVVFQLPFDLAANQIYQFVDENGDVVFSDREPGKNERLIEKIKIENKVTKIPPAYKTKFKAPKKPKYGDKDFYKSFKIVEPGADDEALRSNRGSISLVTKANPPLRSTDTVVVFVDGEEKTSGGESLTVSGIPRGQHTIVAAIISGEGKELIRSNSINTSVLSRSLIFANDGSPQAPFAPQPPAPPQPIK